jgi:DNA-binding transcriptional LysR family regulator
VTRRPHLPDLDALELVVHVARHGSIGAAARAAGMTQQAASERLRSVEAQVGVVLLQRSARGSALTPAGVLLVEWATRLTDVADEVSAAIETLRTGRGRALRVAASMTVAEHLLPGWLVRLRQRQEDHRQTTTTVSLTATNSRQAVRAVIAGSADIGFVEGSARPTGVRSTGVGSDELVLVTTPDTALARARRPLTPAQVAALPLTSREAGSGTRQVVEDALGAHGLEMAAPAVELTTLTAVREAVRAGSAPAFVSRRSVQYDLDAGRLTVVPTADLELVRTLRAVWTGTRTPPAGPVRELLEIARRA